MAPFLTFHTPLLILAALAAPVLAAPPTPVEEFNSITTASTFVAQQQLGIVPAVQSPGIMPAPSSPMLAAPTGVLLQELITTPVQQSATPTTPGLAPTILFMNVGMPVSSKVIFGIIFALILFVALNVAFFCLWNKRCCRARAPDAQPAAPAPSRVKVTVSYLSARPRPSRARPSSVQTVVGEDGSVKGSLADGESPEMPQVARPSQARAPSRPRNALMEGAL